VSTGGMEGPCEGRIEDGRLYGRGAYDMKGAVAAALVAAARAREERLAGDVLVACVIDEEYGSAGTEQLVAAARPADAAIVCEPTGEGVGIAHKGFWGFEIEMPGRAAHGSRPDLGVDAIAAMGPVLTRLGELAARLGRQPGHALVGPGSIHASL